MRFLSKFLVASALFVVVAGGVQAQRPMQQRAPASLGVMVLTNAELQKELKITDDQKKDLKELMTKAEELNKKRAEAMSGGQPDRAVLTELQKSAETLAADVKKTGEKAFTEDQKKRLKQIEVQRMGFAAFSNAEIVKELKISDDQKKAVKEVADGYQKAVRELRTEISGGAQGRLDPEKQAELTKKTAALTTETMEKLMKGMSDDQKKTWKDMTGEKFDMSKLQTRPARRDN